MCSETHLVRIIVHKTNNLIPMPLLAILQLPRKRLAGFTGAHNQHARCTITRTGTGGLPQPVANTGEQARTVAHQNKSGRGKKAAKQDGTERQRAARH